MKKVKYLFLLSIILMCCIELLSFLSSKFNFLIFNEPPFIYEKSKYQSIQNYWTEKEKWGAWHNNKLKVKHKKKCFNVVYETNEIGARDTSFREIKSNDVNIVLLGDSFTEGYGLDKHEMFESHIEKKLENVNLLNFGSSKDFGILQYFIIYQNLAKFYEHDAIIIMLLPNNDFKDNDLDYFRKYKLNIFDGAERYRPYYLKNGDNYEIYYPKNFKKTSSKINLFIKKHFWFSNVLRSIKFIYVGSKVQKDLKKTQIGTKVKKKKVFSAYLSTPMSQQKPGIVYLEKILKMNLDKKIFLFSIPLYDDYLVIKNNDIRKKIYWWKHLKNFQNKYSNFYFFDLYDFANENYKKLFFPEKCDGHWNPRGNKWAGEIISDILRKKLINN